jgi:peptide/nickel transport system substrate-binding protein/oligopeptide transport system substrate-binding protein
VRPAINKILSLCAIVFLLSCTSENRIPGYIYYRLNADPPTLDPALITDVTGGTIAAKLFNGLLRLDNKMDIKPDIAESYSVSKNGLIYRFKLKKGVRFSNGVYVRAGDFKYSFERALNPKTKSPNVWVFDKVEGADDFTGGKAGEVKGIRVIDDYALEIRLKRPFSPFLSLLTMTAAYVVPASEVERWGPDFSSHPSGTGPFTLKEWLPNRHLMLEGNGKYFGSAARVKGIIYRVIPEDLTAVTEFELGNLDVITIPASVYLKYKKDPEWSGLISSMEGLNTYYLGMNCSRPPFGNKILRQAMNYAIDRRKILETLYEGRGRLAKGPVPDMLRSWELKGDYYPYSPDRARALIEEAGFKGGKVEFYITAQEEVSDMAEVIQSYLKSAGLDVRIKQLEWSAFKDAVNKGEPDIFWLSWWADYPDPENFLFPLFHSSNYGPAGNRARYTNHEVDSLIESGQNAQSIKQRDMFYSRAERLIAEDAPWVFFWHRTDYTLRQRWVKGYDIYPIYNIDKGTEVGI